MDAARWRRVRWVFERAAELEGAARAAFLDAECGDDGDLRAEVLSLLRAEEGAPSGFVTPPPPPEPGALGGALRPGTRVGDFTILRELGRGAMGVVHLARQESLGREVALKVVGRGFLSTPEHAERFRREAAAAARLDHPSVARVFAAGEDGGVAWLAMEFVDGISLADELERLSEGSAPRLAGATLPAHGTRAHVLEAARITGAIADGLHHAHQHGIVHRDVKPSNVLLTTDGRVKVVDFGVARDAAFGTLTRSDQIIGSLPYMSPEQARVLQDPVDARTDVYSAGVLLYELLSLERPYQGSTTMALLQNIQRATPRPVESLNRSVPRELAVVCAKAMAREPRDRYGSAAELRDDLERFVRGEPVQARPLALGRRLRRTVVRRRQLLTAGGAAIAAGLGAWRWRARLARPPGHLLTVLGGAGAEVFLRRIDPITAMPGPGERLGQAPLHGVRVEPCYARVVVRGGGSAAPRSYVRWLPGGEETVIDLDVPLAPGAGSRAGMVRFAGGPFRVDGAPPLPLLGHDVQLDPFWLDEAEVSIADFQAFVNATPGATMPDHVARIGPFEAVADRPVTRVPWEDARAYAEWRGKRLPSMAEWLLAARGPALRRFPWGDDEPWRGRTTLDPLRGVDFGADPTLLAGRLAPVRSDPDARTPEGLFHMLGNVAEWTETMAVALDEDPPRVDPFARILCGGSWDAGLRKDDLGDTFIVRSTGSGGRWWSFGFRCASDEPA